MLIVRIEAIVLEQNKKPIRHPAFAPYFAYSQLLHTTFSHSFAVLQNVIANSWKCLIGKVSVESLYLKKIHLKDIAFLRPQEKIAAVVEDNLDAGNFLNSFFTDNLDILVQEQLPQVPKLKKKYV